MTARPKPKRVKLAGGPGSLPAVFFFLMKRDRIVQVGLLLAVTTFVVQALPSPNQGLLSRICLALFAVCLLAALRIGPIGRAGGPERGFWDDVTLAAAALAAIPAFEILDAVARPRSSLWLLATHLLLIGSYTTLLLAVERQPHRRSLWRPADLERTLSLATVLTLVLGMTVYFSLPRALSTRSMESLSPPTHLYAALALVLAIRLMVLAHRCEDPRWRTLYFSLGAMAGLLVAFHLSSHVAFARIGAADDHRQPWAAPLLVALFAFRSRTYPFPGGRRREPGPEDDPLDQSRTSLESLTLVTALAIPAMHLILHRFDLLPASEQGVREAWIFPWVSGLGAIAFVQHRRLGRRMVQAVEERRRIEKILSHNERSLRLSKERRQADEALYFSREKFAKAFRASPYAMGISTLAEGRHLEVNAAYAEALGLEDATAVIGRTATELGVWKGTGDRDAFIQALRRDGAVRDFELRFVNRRGEERMGLVSAEQIDIGGEPCMLTVTLDVTAEQRRQERNRLSAELLDRAAPAVILIDLGGRIEYWNGGAETLFGVSSQRALEKGPETLLFSADPGAWGLAAERTLADGVWTGSLAIPPTPRGRSRVDVWCSLVLDSQGVPRARLVVAE
ncbi:MAG: PAS domain-containing protein [Acidobacteriota bacterium]